MTTEEKVDMSMVDEKVIKIAGIVNAAYDDRNKDVKDILWEAYDEAVDALVEFIGTQWCESTKGAK